MSCVIQMNQRAQFVDHNTESCNQAGTLNKCNGETENYATFDLEFSDMPGIPVPVT